MDKGKGMGSVKIFLVILLVFGLGISIGLSRSPKVSALSTDDYEDLKIFTDVLGLLQKEYVEETNSKDLVYGAVKGMLEPLDPHSAFMPTPVSIRRCRKRPRGALRIGDRDHLKRGCLSGCLTH